jgi:hypothetical protein
MKTKVLIIIAFTLFATSLNAQTDNIQTKQTVGVAIIFKVYKNFYVEPWGALHYVLNNEEVSVNNTEYKTKKLQGEVSLKIGCHF